MWDATHTKQQKGQRSHGKRICQQPSRIRSLYLLSACPGSRAIGARTRERNDAHTAGPLTLPHQQAYKPPRCARSRICHHAHRCHDITQSHHAHRCPHIPQRKLTRRTEARLLGSPNKPQVERISRGGKRGGEPLRDILRRKAAPQRGVTTACTQISSLLPTGHRTGRDEQAPLCPPP